MRWFLSGSKCNTLAVYSLLVRGYMAVPYVAGRVVACEVFTLCCGAFRFCRKCTRQWQNTQIVGWVSCSLPSIHGQFTVYACLKSGSVVGGHVVCPRACAQALKFVRLGNAEH